MFRPHLWGDGGGTCQKGRIPQGPQTPQRHCHGFYVPLNDPALPLLRTPTKRGGNFKNRILYRETSEIFQELHFVLSYDTLYITHFYYQILLSQLPIRHVPYPLEVR